MTTQFDLYQKMLNHQRFQTGMMIGQTAIMGHMAGSLRHLQGEMGAIRAANLEGLAIQQEILQREQFQSELEEFIYNSQKLTEDFSRPDCDQPLSVRYFSLRGVVETVEQLGIGTALIRGRDNKAAFETTMREVQRLSANLEKEQEVKEAIAWAKAEQKRIADEHAAKDQQRNGIARRISDLRATRQQASLASACTTGFDAFINNRPPWHTYPFLGLDLTAIMGKDAMKIFKIFILCILPLPPLGWIIALLMVPAIIKVGRLLAEADANSTVDGEILKLEQQLSAI